MNRMLAPKAAWMRPDGLSGARGRTRLRRGLLGFGGERVSEAERAMLANLDGALGSGGGGTAAWD
jgi:hypothetical protein